MSVLVRRLNLVRRHRLASQLRRELRVRLRVLVVTATRVVVHDPRDHGLPVLLMRTVLKAQLLFLATATRESGTR